MKTVAQTFLAVWAVTGLDAFNASTPDAIGVALTAGVLSVLSSVASAPISNDTDSPSLV